ncbi:hypothetical protein HOLleu_15164 [Holothuria leucospilota]|uniref:Endonuclease/exonuclease/phosphatase domain-containing protein n=1 Tax=Holothuria leucospilota TaxID=206669 RepID=A0A9Q1HCZ6_HOLLE|nr:hypothetical protein HOLleu_15164 [Holothuria leucospilota]
MPYLEVQVSLLEPDFFGITETWAKEDMHPDSELMISGYTMYRIDRKHRTKMRGGGCILYVKNCFNCVLRDDLTNQDGVDSVWCNLCTSHGSKLLIGLCYRSPSNSETENQALYNLIRIASTEQVFIMGDFNHPSIDWDNLCANTADSAFLDLIQDCFLTQHVNEPTHKLGNILDLVLTSESHMIENLVVGDCLATSDHMILNFDLVVNVELKQNSHFHYDYKKGDYTSMREYLSEFDWSKMFFNKSTLEMWDSFKVVMENCVKKFIPKRARKYATKPKWMTKAAQRAAKKKYRLWKQYRTCRTYANYIASISRV